MLKKTGHCLIVIPGLGDRENLLKHTTKNWKKYGIKPYAHTMSWKQADEPFDEKFTKLLNLIDNLSLKYSLLSVLGTSAGGSSAVNAFFEKTSQIYKVINVCGRLRTGRNVFPSLELAGRKSPAFIESVKRAEKSLKSNTNDYKKRILSIKPKFGDELVPSTTSLAKNGTNIEIFSTGHMLSIYLAMQFPKKIINFLNNPII